MSSPSVSNLLAPFAGKRVVLAGCGGGCDVFGAVVPFAKLKALDPATQIVLVNLSFTPPARLAATATRIGGRSSQFFKVPPGVELEHDGEYFPEARLASALGHPVVAFSKRITVDDIADGYCALFESEFSGEAPEVFCLVDGGCDAVLTGSETGLATPAEDMLHLRAVNDALPRRWAAARSRAAGGRGTSSSDAANGAAPTPTTVSSANHPIAARFVVCLGMDVDCGHGVDYDELMQRIDDATQSGTLFARQQLDLSMPEVAMYRAVVTACHPIHTIVQSLVVAALDGHRGTDMPAELVPRTGPDCHFPISELTCTLFAFGMQRVADEVTYLRDIQFSDDFQGVDYIVCALLRDR